MYSRGKNRQFGSNIAAMLYVKILKVTYLPSATLPGGIGKHQRQLQAPASKKKSRRKASRWHEVPSALPHAVGFKLF